MNEPGLPSRGIRIDRQLEFIVCWLNVVMTPIAPAQLATAGVGVRTYSYPVTRSHGALAAAPK
jgi:hypothetical protein